MSIGDTPIDLRPKQRPVDRQLLDACNDAAAALCRHRAHGAYPKSLTTVEIERLAVCLTKGCPEIIRTPWSATAEHYRVVGHVDVLVCNACLYTTTHCQHSQMTWRGPSTDVEDLPGDVPDGPYLICDACGADGT